MATLAEKGEALRQQLGIAPGTPLHEIVSRAENDLGLTAGAGRNLVERIDQCCAVLGVSGGEVRSDIGAAETGVVMGQVVMGQPVSPVVQPVAQAQLMVPAQGSVELPLGRYAATQLGNWKWKHGPHRNAPSYRGHNLREGGHWQCEGHSGYRGQMRPIGDSRRAVIAGRHPNALHVWEGPYGDHGRYENGSNEGTQRWMLLPEGVLRVDHIHWGWAARDSTDYDAGGFTYYFAPPRVLLDMFGAGGTAVQPPQPAHMQRFAEPPNNAAPFHPEGDNYFWRYYKPTDEGCPCEHEACLKSCCCPACLHGEITRWATGEDKTLEWLLCWPICGLCMIENDRNLVERKIHEFHRARGDPRAQREPVRAGEGVICVGLTPGLGGLAAYIMHAQNYWVMKEFQRVQAEFL